MGKIKHVVGESVGFLRQWWRDRRDSYFWNGGMRWYDCKIMSIVCGHEGPGYGSWVGVPRSVRLPVEVRGWLLNKLSRSAEDRLLWALGIFHVLRVAWCAAFGHTIVDESYGGPDSGCMAGSCSRCGWGFHTQLY
jgi:hypothetical protein